MSRPTALIILGALALSIIWVIAHNILSVGWFETLAAGGSVLVAFLVVAVAAIAWQSIRDLGSRLWGWLFPCPPPWDQPVVVDEATAPDLVETLLDRLEPVREFEHGRFVYLRDRNTGQLWEQYAYDFEFHSFKRLTPVQHVPEEDAPDGMYPSN